MEKLLKELEERRDELWNRFIEEIPEWESEENYKKFRNNESWARLRELSRTIDLIKGNLK